MHRDTKPLHLSFALIVTAVLLWVLSTFAGLTLFENNVAAGALKLDDLFSNDNQTARGTRAQLTGGAVVTVWETASSASQESNDIYGHLKAADDSARGTEFPINADSLGRKLSPSVAKLTTGGFVVTWASRLDDWESQIRARRFDATGHPLESHEIVVACDHSSPRSSCRNPGVAGTSDGGFVIVWTDDSGAVSSQRFTRSGESATAGPTIISTESVASVLSHGPMITSGPHGFIVVWAREHTRGASPRSGGKQFQIYARILGEDAAPKGDALRIELVPTAEELTLDVHPADQDRFFVVWRNDSGIYGREVGESWISEHRIDLVIFEQPAAAGAVGNDTDSAGSDLNGPLNEYDIYFRIAEAATYGGLQWQTNYSDAPVGFIGSGAGVDCSFLNPAPSIPVFNDIEAESNLNIGIIALFGFTTTAGQEIVRCGFEGTSMPSAADFAITVQDSADTDGQPLTATITIGRIVPRNPVITTTTNTVTTTSITSTTLPQQTTRCDITFSVTSSPPGGVLGALSFETVYPADSNFDGAGSAVNCTPLAGGVLASFNNQEGNNALLTGIIGIPGLNAPGDVSQCSYLSASGGPTAADFAITVTEANTGGLEPVDVTATTTVEITKIECDTTPTTTTSTSTTSTSTTSTTTTSTSTTLTPQTETECEDGLDNDGDELIDCDDPDCSGAEGCVVFCAAPIEDTVTCTKTIRGNTTSGSSTIEGYNVPQCGGCCPQGNEELVYRFQPEKTGEVIIRLDGMSTDQDLYVLDGGCVPDRDCIAHSDVASDHPELVTFQAEAGSSYFVIVENYANADREDGQFELTFNTDASGGCSTDPCGNGIIETGEQCDGDNLGDDTCNSLGFDQGDLSCDASCQFDTSGCSRESECGCMDVAFVVDDTASMGGAISSVKTGLLDIINAVDTASGGDFRMALVRFADDIEIDQNYTTSLTSIQNAIDGLQASGGGNTPEASDEALNQVVTEPPTTTTSSTSTTSTTTLPQQTTRCDITFSVTSSPPGGFLGALDFNTVYPAGSNFDGAGADVNCTPLVGGVLPSFNNQEQTNTLLTGIIGIPGLSAPGDVSQCSYLSASGVPTAADFAITVTDANTDGTTDVTATTTVEITEIACDGTLGRIVPRNPVITTTTNTVAGDCSVAGTLGRGRSECLRIAILITDAPPGGCDDSYDVGADDINAANVAATAAENGWRVSAVQVGDDSIASPIMKNYASATDGAYTLLPSDGTGTADVIEAIIEDCGLGNGSECGNGIEEEGEECDDGRQCDDLLTPCLTNADCAGLSPGEQCAPRDGDCCSQSCLFEQRQSPCGAPACSASSDGPCTAETCTASNCYDMREDGVGGCNDPLCESSVCEVDPFCCDDWWDETCVNQAVALCEGREDCGDQNSTECSAPDTCDGLGVCLPNDKDEGTLCGDQNSTECSAPDTCDGLGACLTNHKDEGTSCGDPNSTECSDPDTCDGGGECLLNHQREGTTCCHNYNICLESQCADDGECPTPKMPKLLCGDAHEDGSVNTTDAFRVLEVAVGRVDESECDPCRCDVDDSCDDSGSCTNNGEIGILDARRILQYVTGVVDGLFCYEETERLPCAVD